MFHLETYIHRYPYISKNCNLLTNEKIFPWVCISRTLTKDDGLWLDIFIEKSILTTPCVKLSCILNFILIIKHSKITHINSSDLRQHNFYVSYHLTNVQLSIRQTIMINTGLVRWRLLATRIMLRNRLVARGYILVPLFIISKHRKQHRSAIVLAEY